MKQKLQFSLMILIIVLTFGCLESETNKIETKKESFTLQGTVVDSVDDTIILYQPHEDPYFQNIKIPIVDGKFSYEFEVDEPVGYDLMYWNNGNPGGRWMTVFLEQNDINLRVYSQEEWDRNVVQGGRINNEFQVFDSIRAQRFTNEMLEIYKTNEHLHKSGRYYSPEMQRLLSRKKDAKGNELASIEGAISNLRQNDLHTSDSVKVLLQRSNDLSKKKKEWERIYMDKNKNAVAYHLFLTELSYSPDQFDLQEGFTLYEKFSTSFPDHPYNDVVQKKLESLANIKVGERFKDFTLPDLNGEQITLSEEVKGKVAVINLWATWCKPCIVKNRELAPVVNEFKEENFTVVGVAGEYKNTERLERFLEKEKYPWKNLVELDAQNFIWEKYGVSRSGGGLFLIDEKGNIVAVEPSVKEIRDYLKSKI